ncbi:PAS domain S-box protein [Candidatus Fermentibacteria bacterium]|nr:PAS domain S-box protein [Candidatus Fermentibacteria bacterium]
MKLSTKLTVIMGGATVAFFLVALAVSDRIVRSGFSRLEERHARADVDHARAAIDRGADALGVTAADWAMWDDTYQFVQDQNPAYAEGNLTPLALSTLRIHALMIVDESCGLAWGQMLSPEDTGFVPLPDKLRRLAEAGGVLTTFDPDRDRISGIVVLAEGPMLVAAHRILTSQREGPARGTLVMGRFLDADAIGELAEALQVEVNVFRVDDLAGPTVPDGVTAAWGVDPPVIRVISPTVIAGYGLVRDLSETPALVVEVRMPRDISAQGTRTSAVFAGTLLAAASCLTFVIAVTLRWQIIGRLASLSRGIRRISTAEDFSGRVTLAGSDELSAIADDVNHLVTRVAESRRALVKSEERIGQIANSVADWIWEVDAEGLYTYASPAVERILGYAPEEIVGKKHFYDLFAPEEQQAKKRAALDTMARRVRFIALVNTNVHKDGRRVVLETNGVPVVDQQGKLLGYRGADRDITERTLAEEAMKEAAVETQRLLETAEQSRRALLSVVEDQKRAEEALRQSTVLLDTAGRMARFGAWSVNLAENRVTWSDQVAAIHEMPPGYSPTVEQGLGFYAPICRERIAQVFGACAREGTPYDEEFEIIAAGGSRVWVRTIGHAIRDGTGAIVKVEGAFQDITERKRVEGALHKALAEKDVLLREVHHRVKNNLMAMMALMQMKRERIGDERLSLVLLELEEQARAMSLVYEQLYQSDSVAHVEMGPYLSSLTQSLVPALRGERDIIVEVDADPVVLDVEQAMPCGLIVNELVTNALKHAFPPSPGRRGTIHVSLAKEGEACLLTVADDGAGMPRGGDAITRSGLRMVGLWATHQLGGTIEIVDNAGTTVTVRFSEG